MQSKGPKKLELSKFTVYIVLGIVFIFFSIALSGKGFIASGNLLNILRQTAMVSVMAVAGVFVLGAGQIDLTVGSTAAMSAMFSALVLQSTNNILLAIIASILFGIFVGFINGLLVTKLKLPSFLALTFREEATCFTAFTTALIKPLDEKVAPDIMSTSLDFLSIILCASILALSSPKYPAVSPWSIRLISVITPP